MIWARAEMARIHPDAVAARPPTVSRAIAEPIIGDPFAMWIVLVAVLQAFAVLRIAQATYRTVLSPPPARHRSLSVAMFASMLGAEALAVAGVVILSQYTGSVSDYWHQTGSYMMFFGNGMAILLFGIFITLVEGQRTQGTPHPAAMPLPYEPKIHTRFAWLTSLVGILFGYLYFYGFDDLMPYNEYAFRLAFAMSELVLLVASLAYLGSFLRPMYRHELHLLMQRAAAADSVPVVGKSVVGES